MGKEYKHPLFKSDNVKKEAHVIRNEVLIGDWEEVTSKRTTDVNPNLEPGDLDGLLIRGYEMKWEKMNENKERYDKTAFDDFIKRYFVEGGLNMPVDIDHQGTTDWRAYCGRVLYCETNSIGLYFVVYVPRTYVYYDHLVWCLKNGIIQGFSKYGFVDWDDFDYIYNEDGSFSHEQIHKMSVICVSLVTVPANGYKFEQMRQTLNAFVFEAKNETKTKTKKDGKSLADLFK